LIGDGASPRLRGRAPPPRHHTSTHHADSHYAISEIRGPPWAGLWSGRAGRAWR
jgi:hypothetical protein